MNNTISLQIEVIRSALEMIIDSKRSLKQHGLTQEDYALVNSKALWTVTDRSRVVQIIESLIFSSMDARGLDRLVPPAEYIAAIIMLTVNPINYFLACRWFGMVTEPADSIVSASNLQINPSELFSHIVLAYGQLSMITYRQRLHTALSVAQPEIPDTIQQQLPSEVK